MNWLAKRILTGSWLGRRWTQRDGDFLAGIAACILMTVLAYIAVAANN